MTSNFKIYITVIFYIFLFTNTSIADQYSDSVPHKLIFINEDVLQAFKTIWNTEHAPLIYDEYKEMDTIMEGGDMDIIKSTIFDYFYNTDTTEDTLGFMDLFHKNVVEYKEKPSIKENYITLEDEKIDSNSLTVNNKIITPDEKTKLKPQKKSEKKTKKSDKLKHDIKKSSGKDNQQKFIPASDNDDIELIFNVQIAASHEILDLRTIRQIYNGNYPIFINYEDGWYKYRIGKIPSIIEANKLKFYSNVEGSFIVAYKDNKKLSLEEYKKIINEPIALQDKKYQFYKIQVAASKELLSQNFLCDIYNGKEPVNLIVDGDWYKYQIGQYNNIEAARLEKVKCEAKNAFLVTYINGQKDKIENKIYTPEPKKKGREIITVSDTIIFKIQVAAEKQALSNYTIISKYRNFEKINIVYEDGLFKYFVGEFDNYFDALKVKNKLKNKEAFIVAYKNNNRIKLNEAINYKKY